MHPALSPLKFLIGKWKSSSALGKLPAKSSARDFHYEETIEFQEIGQPLLNFTSFSKIGDRPMHLESGFLRINPGTSEVAFVVSHNFGICSIEEGNVDETKVQLESTAITRIAFAKSPNVTKIRRIMTMLEDGQLEIRTDMSTESDPELTNHLVVLYKKLN